nr:hypothetical protein [Tanacetum cinerariifolium]
MDLIIPLGQKNTLAEYMILFGADNRPPMLDKDLVTITKKYADLSAAEKIQATNIILQGFAVPVFTPGDDLVAGLNKAITFLTDVASSRFPLTNNQLRTSSNTRNQATIQDGRVTIQQVQRRQGQSYFGTGYKSNATSSRETMQVDKQGLLNAITVKVKDIWLGNSLSLSNQAPMMHLISLLTLRGYLRFTQLINDRNIYIMKMKQFQVNTKFLNNLPPE